MSARDHIAAIERLESRTLLSMSAGVTAGLLTVTLDTAGEHAFISYDLGTGNVRVGTTDSGNDLYSGGDTITAITVVDNGAATGQAVTFSGSTTISGTSVASLTAVSTSGIETVDVKQLLDVTADSAVSGNAGTVNVASPGRIQHGLNFSAAGATVNVGAGNYTENVTINKNLTLRSDSGRALTTITGISNGALGAVTITTPSTTAVTLGGAGHGFHIVGIDNPSPGIESAAVYIQGSHSGVQILDNEIEANGDSGLTAEQVTNSGFVIDGNTFSGKTFVGANPAGNGFGAQFTLANVPRQLVVMGNGGGAGAGITTGITFTNNILSGIAGGTSLTDNTGAPVAAHEQGNTLATLDVSSSTISGNTFQGTTNRFGSALRSRRPGATISGNTFDSSGMGANTSLLFVQNNATPLGAIVAANTFNDGGIFVSGSDTVFVSLQNAINATGPGGVLNLLAGAYTGVTTLQDISLVGAGAGSTFINGASPALTVTAGTTTLSGLTLTNAVDSQPVVLVNGSGSLNLTTSTINGTFSSQTLVQANTSGSLNLGTTGTIGNNTFNIAGGANTTGDAYIDDIASAGFSAVGNLYDTDDTAGTSYIDFTDDKNFADLTAGEKIEARTIVNGIHDRVDQAARAYTSILGDTIIVPIESATAAVGSAGAIGRAVGAASSGNFVLVGPGSFDEAVNINKSLTLLGAAAHASVIAPAIGAQQSVINVDATNVTIDGLAIQVNQNDDPGIGGTAPVAPVGIAAVGAAPGTVADFNGLVIQNTLITSIGDNTVQWTGSPGLGLRAAGIVLYDSPSGGIPSVTLADNDVNIVSGTSFFQRAVWLAQLNAQITGNTFKGAANDLLFQFPSGGPSLIDDNDFVGAQFTGGGGVVIGDPNAGAPVTISNNDFTPDNAHGFPVTSLQVNRNAVAGSAIQITGNTFTGHTTGVDIGGAQDVSVSDNTFTPKPGYSGYVHVRVDSQNASNNASTGTPINTTIDDNTFNTAAGSTGTAVLVANNLAGSNLTGVSVGVTTDNVYQTGVTTGVAVTGGVVTIEDTIAGVTTGATVSGGTLTLASSALSVNTTGVSVSGTGTLTVGAGNTISGGATGVRLDGGAVGLTGLTLNNLVLTGQSGDYVTLANAALDNQTIDGTNVTYGGVLGSSATVAQGLAIEAKISHELDNSTLGLIQVTANTLYVPSTGVTSTTPTATDNDYTRIKNAVEAAGSNFTIYLEGTFDWTEPNAAASWALGNDGTDQVLDWWDTLTPGISDDYTIAAPSGLTNVTLTAATPGAATIQGPGDLSAHDGESFLGMWGPGGYQGWTISNLNIQDFDVSIAMFFDTAVTEFNSVSVENNFIRIPADLNATVAPVEVSQNIGIHYSFGTNQTFADNTFEIVGSGLSAGSNFSSSVGMQSNTSGGAVYDGLLIDNNTLNVTGSLAVQPSAILGIWENAHGHSSNITVSNNEFNNLTGANAATNLMRAFRVTSHSSATTTVAYSDNTVDGANIGFQWITGSNFALQQPVELTDNSLTNVNTGVLVQSNGLVTLTGNSFANSGAMAGVGTALSVAAGSSATLDGTVDENAISGFATGILATGSVVVTGNNASIFGNAIGIDVNAGSATISSNHIYNNGIGIRLTAGGTASVTSNSFDGGMNPDNVTDLQLTSTAGSLTALTGNTFAGDTFFIDNQSTQNVDVTPGTGNTLDVANNFRVEDQMHHRVDTDLAVTTGLVTWVAGNLYVTDAGTDHSIQRGIDSATAGNTVNVEAGFFNEDVNENKAVNLVGAGASVTTISGPIGGAGSTVAIAASNATLSGFKITRDGNNTTDWNNPGLNSAGVSIQGAFTGIVIRDNLITQNRTGIDVNNSSGHTIRNNVITDNRTGLIFRNQTDNLTVVENEITQNWTVGILFLDASGGTNSPVQSAANSTFSNNDLSGNWYGQIVDRQTGGSLPAPGANPKNFSSNWFGTTTPVITSANTTEPGYAAQIPVAFGGSAVAPGGQPDIAGAASANFDITPYLNTATDTNIETTPGRGTYGFQGSFANITVTSQLAQTGATNRIQEGVDIASTGGTVHVLGGSYAGSVTVNSAVTIAPGASPAVVTITGNLTFSSGTLLLDVNSPYATPGVDYDKLVVSGNVDLSGATVTLVGGGPSASPSALTMISTGGTMTPGTNPVEGTLVTLGVNQFTLTYAGGAGDDLVLDPDFYDDIQMMSARTNGTTQQLFIEYTIVAGNLPLTSFDVGIYRSDDTVFGGGDVLVSTVTISAAGDLTPGLHTVAFTIGTGGGQVALPGFGAADVDTDYYLLAVADPTDVITEGDATINEDNKVAVTGIYHAASGPVMVQGTDGIDVVTVSFGASTTVTFIGALGSPAVYTNASVTEFRFRLHGGNEVINLAASTKPTLLAGGGGNDTLTGGSSDDILLGGAGNDSLVGNNGNDLLAGEGGNDTMAGGTGNDTYTFNADVSLGTDTLTETGTAGSVDTLDFSATLANAVTARLGIATLQVVNANLSLTLNSATLFDNVIGGAQSDTIIGNGGANKITGGAGNDSLTGAGGSDTYVFDCDSALGVDSLIEGASDGTGDTLDFSGTATQSILVNLSTTALQTVNTNLQLLLSTGTTFENVIGGALNDVLTGNTAANRLEGSGGNDTLTGGTGNDTYAFAVNAPLGDDTLVESSGIDTLDFSGTTAAALTVDLSLPVQQTVNGSLTVTLGSGTVFENVIGGSLSDALTGNVLANAISGGGGNDTITAGAGNDSLTGGAGDDSLLGGTNNDTYVFDADSPLGTDSLTELAAEGTDLLDFSTTTTLGMTVDLSNSPAAQVVNSNLSLSLSSATTFENVTGGSQNDALTGNTLDNVLSGGAGNDTLNGAAGNDTYVYDTDSQLASDSITDPSGIDTIDFSATTTKAATIDLSSIAQQIVNINLKLTLASGSAIENVTGGSQNDSITGNTLDNLLAGGPGLDSIFGGAGNDTLVGGAGNDSLTGGADNDVYQFTANSALGTDTLNETGGGIDTLDFSTTTLAIAVNLGTPGAQAVNSSLTLNLGSSTTFENVIGGSGNDTLTGNTAANSLTGSAGNDTLSGLADSDTLLGGAGNDTLIGGADNDTLTGGADNDVYAFTANAPLGSDTLDESGGGIDTLDLAATTSAVVVDLGSAGAQAVNANLTLTLNSGTTFENVIGGNQGDTLTGNSNANTLTGGAGNDTLAGLAGDDTLIGGANDDTYLFAADGTLGTDTLNETGGGTDTLDFSSTAATAININLGLATVQVVNASLSLILGSATTIENAIGGSLGDTLTGNTLNNGLSGGAGNDTLTGGKGNDTLYGDSGDDVYSFTASAGAALGSDTLSDVSGVDLLDFSLTTAGITISLSTTGLQAVNANLQLTLTSGTEFEMVVGSSSNDNISGNTLDNVLIGGAGIDTINGQDGRDLIVGGSGGDALSGDNGDDILIGGQFTYYNETSKVLNRAAIDAIMAEWTGINVYSTRVTNLRASLLTTLTVPSDATVDTLFGDADDDYFWIFGSDASDLGVPELFND